MFRSFFSFSRLRGGDKIEKEICGDGRMSLWDRLRYMAQNFLRNFSFRQSTVASKKFCMPRQSRTSGLASPSRALTEAFLCRQLPDLLPVGEIRVLDIGCGAGGLVRLLAELGYRGSYVGIDIQDTFDRSEEPGFKKEFLVVDAHQYQPEEKFDLVVSVSALEHIPNDSRLISRLAEFLTARGLQLHFVPSQWALPVYLWHGYRQYTVWHRLKNALVLTELKYSVWEGLLAFSCIFFSLRVGKFYCA